MFPGPGTWVIPSDLWFGKENFGMARSAQCLVFSARADKLRVSTLGCHFGMKGVTPQRLRRLGEDNIYQRMRTLQHALIHSDFGDRIGYWANWYNTCYCSVLVDNARWLSGKGISASNIISEISAGATVNNREQVDKIVRTFQKVALKAIKDVHAPDVVERIRYKMDRWDGWPFGLTGLPEHYGRQMARRIAKVGQLVPPRVQAAVFTTCWNGWCTHRRFQKRHLPTNVCVFKCSSSSEDSLEHYCRCPVILKAARHTLHFSYPEEMGLDLWVLNSSWLDIDYNMRSLALLVYGTYMAFNRIRHGFVSDSHQAFLCITQFCKLGAGGHNGCISHLDGCWMRPMNYVC